MLSPAQEVECDDEALRLRLQSALQRTHDAIMPMQTLSHAAVANDNARRLGTNELATDTAMVPSAQNQGLLASSGLPQAGQDSGLDSSWTPKSENQ